MDISTPLPVLASLIVIGRFAGLLAGFLGVGGGIVLVPTFFYAFQSLGYDGPQLMQVCLAASLATITATSIRLMQIHHKKGAVDWLILSQWAPGIAIGAILGVALAANLQSQILQLIFGGLGATIGLYLALGRQSWSIGETVLTGRWRIIIAPLLGEFSVLLGIGGGSLGVPFMTLHRVPIHRAAATAAGFGLAIAVPSALVWLFVSVDALRLPWRLGAVNLLAFFVIISMTFIFVPIGANVVHRTDAGHLKRLFWDFLLLVEANMLLSALW